MKQYIIIISICVFVLSSCGGNNHKSAGTVKKANQDASDVNKMNAPAQNMEYCFIRTEGKSNQDTTAIHLVIKANIVIGEMQWMPKEKDARKGTLSGNINGNDIKALWTFMQEGTKDTMAVDLRLSAQQLAQKPYKATQDGRQETDNASGYTIIYKLDNCSKFKTAVKPPL